MARRGGRGRGRGGGSKSVSRELLQRSLAESGTAVESLTPKLYPDFRWKSTGGYWDEPEETLCESQRPAGTVYLLNKQRELLERFQTVGDPDLSQLEGFIPEELRQKNLPRKKRKKELHFAPEDSEEDDDGDGSEAAGGGGGEEMEDETGDYTRDYYESEDENELDDGEATFD